MIALGGAYSHVFVSMLILGVLRTFSSPPLARRMYQANVKSNSNYSVLIPVQGTPLSIMKGKDPVRRGSSSEPCVEGDSCWELLSDKWYSELKSDKVSGNGTIVVTPKDGKKSSTKILVRDLNGTSRGLPTPKGVGQNQVLELDPKTNSVTFLLYNEPVKNTDVSGNIQKRPENVGQSRESVRYLSPVYKEKNAVLLTGYIGTNGEMFQGTLAGNGAMQIFIFNDSNAPDYNILRVSFRSSCAVNTWKITMYVLSLIVWSCTQTGGHHEASGDVSKRPTATARNICSRLPDPVQLRTKQLRRRNWKTAPNATCRTRDSGTEKCANSQVAARSTRPGHTFKFDEAEILARGDNRVSQELLESWFTGPQSINKCNDIPTPYSVLQHRLDKQSTTRGGRKPVSQMAEQSPRQHPTRVMTFRQFTTCMPAIKQLTHQRATILDEG
ncbi:hypothetical protein SprV_0802478600 [Sparganum proliferum]